jgi:hypothetical protein
MEIMQIAPTRSEGISFNERYRLGEMIGRGGLGEVYRGEDTQLCRPVALKRLQGVAGKVGEGGASILQEARHLAALQHPNIVTVYDVVENRGDVVVVMELLEGRTLQDVAEEAPLTVEDFVPVMEQALQGLMAAHAKGMLHRDIKPGNLMLSRLPGGEMQLKILDFGLAKMAPEPSEQTRDQNGALMGSIYMMAPEQFEGRPLDGRSDLYSLGCAGYFALTAASPFSGDTVAEVITAHLQGRCTPIKELRPDLPAALCAWVHSLMSVRPEDRPESAAEALAQLRRAVQGKTVVPDVPVVTVVPQASRLAAGSPGWHFRLSRFHFADFGVGALLLVIGAFCYFRISMPESLAGTVPVLAPQERRAVLDRLGERVIVEGVVKEVMSGKGGFRYLRFVETGEKDLALAFFATENPLEQLQKMSSYVGRKVRVVGTVSQHEDLPVIFIDSFSQLETL